MVSSLTMSQELGATVIVVNMPLRQDNLELMPPGFYELFKRTLKAECKNSGVSFLDLANNFSPDDFEDGVHLNAHGGWKLINYLIPVICDAMQKEKPKIKEPFTK